jgi:hypothetical protein
MKNLLILTIVFSLFNVYPITAINDTAELDRNNFANKQFINPPETNQTADLMYHNNLKIPYAKGFVLEPEYVIGKEEYSLWRIKSEQIKEIPGCSAIGQNYHYFVFKNGQFLLTVNQCNKDNIYHYFAG